MRKKDGCCVVTVDDIHEEEAFPINLCTRLDIICSLDGDNDGCSCCYCLHSI